MGEQVEKSRESRKYDAENFQQKKITKEFIKMLFADTGQLTKVKVQLI